MPNKVRTKKATHIRRRREGIEEVMRSMESLVDLEQYPLDRPDSEEFAQLLLACRSAWVY